jgi:hypothetical protein
VEVDSWVGVLGLMGRVRGGFDDRGLPHLLLLGLSGFTVVLELAIGGG